MSKWNQNTITKWAMKTFGSPNDLRTLVSRTMDECFELERASFEENERALISEAADITIFLMQLAEHMGFDLLEQVDDKMDINDEREWDVKGDGTGQHKCE